VPYGVQVRPQTRLESCTSGHLCYDENVGTCRLDLVRRALSQLSSRQCQVRCLDRSLTMWSGRLHMVRHPGQVMDIECERIDKTFSRHDTYKYVLIL
jgi:hypothetical protein